MTFQADYLEFKDSKRTDEGVLLLLLHGEAGQLILRRQKGAGKLARTF